MVNVCIAPTKACSNASVQNAGSVDREIVHSVMRHEPFSKDQRQDSRSARSASSMCSRRKCTIPSLKQSYSSRGTKSRLEHLVAKVNYDDMYLRSAMTYISVQDSTVLAYVMKTLNDRYQYGLDLYLLSIDEGITGYRDDSLEVRRDICHPCILS